MWIFAPAWRLLHLLMAVAVWLACRDRGFPGTASALALFLVQLAAHALWAWRFSAWHLGALAFVEIVVPWAPIVATIVAFRRVRPLAAALLLPYLAWVTFASALAWSTWKLHPGILG